MKFSEVPIGAKILIYKQQVNIKLESELVFNETLGHLENENPDTEVELISKCENCKFNSLKTKERKAYCDKLDKYIMRQEEDIFDIATLRQDPATFSCRHFEMRAE